jgi:hypothetical protein
MATRSPDDPRRVPESRDTAPVVQTEYSIHVSVTPTVESSMDGRGWLTQRFYVDSWLVGELVLYVPPGEEATVRDRIVHALQNPD